MKDEWLTPPWILRPLGIFDLDPCAPVERPWDTALQHFTLRENGLARRWSGRIWLNPPYGSETGKWLRRLAEHGNGIALIFARTETGDWFDHVWGKAAEILFIKGRLHFYHISGIPASGNSGAPSALIAYTLRKEMKLNFRLKPWFRESRFRLLRCWKNLFEQVRGKAFKEDREPLLLSI
jgi:hypothetical protein